MIPVLGFCTVKRFDLADRLLRSIDYPVEHLVVVDNSGEASWNPVKPDLVKHLWLIRVPYGLGLTGAWNLIIKSTPYAPFWLLVNDDAWFEPGALQTVYEQADPNAMNFLQCEPKWSAPVFGERVIRDVGLYDESFYPLYFDDNDFERRIDYAGIDKKYIQAVVHHENSSTLQSGFQAANNRTYLANLAYWEKKQAANDYTQGQWSLEVRRANRWD